MKSSLRVIVAVGSLCAAANVYADLHPGAAPCLDTATDATYPGTAHRGASSRVELGAPLLAGEPSSSIPLCAGDWTPGYLPEPLAPVPVSNVDLSTCGEVRQLPPLPGSARLFLSAMLSIGAWHLGRSVRHIHLGALPEWYHTAGPAQIGHAVPFDFDFSAPPLCCFEHADAGGGEQPPFYLGWREPGRCCCDARAFLAIAAPRAPPALA